MEGEAQGHDGKLLFKSETSDTITEKRKQPRRYVPFIVIHVCGFFLSFQQRVLLPSHALIATLPLMFL